MVGKSDESDGELLPSLGEKVNERLPLQPPCFAHLPFESVAIHCPMQPPLGYGNENLRIAFTGSEDSAKGIDGERPSLSTEELISEPLTA